MLPDFPSPFPCTNWAISGPNVFSWLKTRKIPLWPQGDNTVINVESAGSCCANIIYNAFVRQFGGAKWPRNPMVPQEQEVIQTLEAKGYTVIPESGKFRDLIKES